MITLIVGPDTARSGARETALTGKAQRQLLTGADLTHDALCARAQSASLFGETYTFGLVGAFEENEGLRSKELIAALQASTHLFVIEEESGADLAKLVEKAGGEVIKAKAGKKEEPPSTFALANALGARDRKALWLYFMEAQQTGASAEMLVGMLAWKARQMLASEKKGRVPVGWKAGESEKLSSDLVSLYHESRRGAGDLDLLLEKFILTL